jgi:general secretion pathway protein D
MRFCCASLLLLLLALAACGGQEARPRPTGHFDEAMRRLAGAGQRPPDVTTVPSAVPPRASSELAEPLRGRRAFVDPGSPLAPRRGPASAAAPPGAAPAADGTVTLNFVDAEIAQVVQAVLGDLLGTDYTLDPRVAGTVTLQTQRPVPQAAALSLLESALGASGVALIQAPSGGGWRVVPLDQALQSGPPGALRAAGAQPGPGFAVVALPLQHARAADVQRVLQPLAPRGGAVLADETRNILLLAGTGPQLSTLVEAAEGFDVDWLRGQSVALLPLDAAPAPLVAQEITTLFGNEAGARRDALRIVPVARMNAVLVVTSQPALLDRVRRWVTQLDAGGLGATPQLFVHGVQYVRATDLANTLRQLLQGSGRGYGAGALLAPGQAGVMAVAGAATPLPTGGNGGGIAPEGAPGNGAGMAPGAVPGAVPGGPPGAAPPPGMPFPEPNGSGVADGLPAAPVRIVADDSQNALIVYASQPDWRLVERAILLLDRPPSQVAIDATIAEVTLNDGLEYGLSWFFRSGNFEFRQAQTDTGVVGPSFPGFNAIYNGGLGAGAVLHALADMTDVRVISSPQVVVQSNQTARLRVGDSVPVVTQQAIGTSVTDARIVNSISFRDTGVSLDVTPRVNASGRVLLEVDQDVSDAIRTTTSGIDSPTIQQRRLRSVVSIGSGETVALGGLIRESDNNTRTGLPFLLDVPVVRELFGVTTRDRRRTELLVLITPRVVQSTEELRRVTEELRQRMHGMAPRPPAAPPGGGAPGSLPRRVLDGG